MMEDQEELSQHDNYNNINNRIVKNFENGKAQCLGKRDKSFAGRIDPKAVDICAIINGRDEYFTTSSCSGRCFLYRLRQQQQQEKSANADDNSSAHNVDINGDHIARSSSTITSKTSTDFERFRISHDIVSDPDRYFDLNTIETDPSGGADPLRSIGQYDYQHQKQPQQQSPQHKHEAMTPLSTDCVNNDDSEIQTAATREVVETANILLSTEKLPETRSTEPKSVIWLRVEPFILHVACRSIDAAKALMTAARPTFKNVGLTSWSNNKSNNSKYIVAIWGDEGLDMPLCTPDGMQLFATKLNKRWLAELVQERLERNWTKISRFVQSVRDMPPLEEELSLPSPSHVSAYYSYDTEKSPKDTAATSEELECYTGTKNRPKSSKGASIPKSFDVIGDVALLHALPPDCDDDDNDRQEAIGKAIMAKNKAIKIVAVRRSKLDGVHRAPGTDGIRIIAATNEANKQRNPIITTHSEYGIKCVVDLNHTFFSPRMGHERLRLCQQVARGENVLVLFAGVGMEALQIAARTEANKVVAIEYNPIAIQCFQRAHRMLKRNKVGVKCIGAADRLYIHEGDVRSIIPTLDHHDFDRILAPRPKHGALDGNQPESGNNIASNDDNGDDFVDERVGGVGGVEFLKALLPVMKNGGECHWYDFVADHEFPVCERTKSMLKKCCTEQGLSMEVLHIANAGSVAKRQLRNRPCEDRKIMCRGRRIKYHAYSRTAIICFSALLRAGTRQLIGFGTTVICRN